MDPITTKKDLYLELIRDIYNAEVLLIPELRFFISKSKSEPLKKALASHLSNTRSHVDRLEDLQEDLNANLLQEHCRTMKSMIIETKELVGRCANSKLIEQAIIISLHRISQCMITMYQILISMADELKLDEHKNGLQKNLEEEINTDKEISAIEFNALFQEFDIIQKLSL